MAAAAITGHRGRRESDGDRDARIQVWTAVQHSHRTATAAHSCGARATAPATHATRSAAVPARCANPILNRRR